MLKTKQMIHKVGDGMKKSKKYLKLVSLFFVIWLLIFLFSIIALTGSYTSEPRSVRQAKSLTMTLEFFVLILISIFWFYTYLKHRMEKNPH